ncbi:MULTISPECIES: hypothetical protein [Aquimarina]|uniref:hypothetical protein n=1 Tax=Aquimarina TaxID=290174 RepID=UPI000D6999D0|nr:MULTISPECIES: hypothetical protein [Aquimarina]
MNRVKILSFVAILLFAVGCGKQKDFNSTEWKNWEETETTPNTRWLMHKDLLSKYELEGVSKGYILNLLGKPDSETNNKYYYQLGVTGKGINTGTMTIKFESDSVVNIEITNG